MHIASIGIDLGKTIFHLVALGEHNKVLVGKKRSRALKFESNRRHQSFQ
jgi:transposase